MTIEETGGQGRFSTCSSSPPTRRIFTRENGQDNERKRAARLSLEQRERGERRGREGGRVGGRAGVGGGRSHFGCALSNYSDGDATTASHFKALQMALPRLQRKVYSPRRGQRSTHARRRWGRAGPGWGAGRRRGRTARTAARRCCAGSRRTRRRSRCPSSCTRPGRSGTKRRAGCTRTLRGRGGRAGGLLQVVNHWLTSILFFFFVVFLA